MNIYTIPAHKRGDTWNGINTISFSTSGVPLNFTNVDNIKIEFRQSIDSPVVLSLSTKENQIQIVNPSRGIIRILPLVVQMPPGRYFYDLQVTYLNGVIKTYLTGSWDIVADITK
jgi:hypothetical protein